MNFNKIFNDLMDYLINSYVVNLVPVSTPNISPDELANHLYDLSIIILLLTKLIIFLLFIFFFNIFFVFFREKILNYFKNKYIQGFLNFYNKIVGIVLIFLGFFLFVLLEFVDSASLFLVTHPISLV
jgi:hypothetical protein